MDVSRTVCARVSLVSNTIHDVCSYGADYILNRKIKTAMTFKTFGIYAFWFMVGLATGIVLANTL